MAAFQSGILEPVPSQACHLSFSLAGTLVEPVAALTALAGVADGRALVVGLGHGLVASLGKAIPGLKPFPVLPSAGVAIPSTPFDLWCWLRGDDRGELLHRRRALEELLAPAFRLEDGADSFRYGASLDLTGYEDGTENPTGDDAMAAAFVAGQADGLTGGSFVAVQRWRHDLDCFEAMDQEEQDHTFGRRKSDNEEIEDAPLSAHVKRTAQESFEPEAFVLRRSMPWSGGGEAGLVFVAFGASFDAYEAQLQRMTGLEDGITDALFRFTRPMTGAYFWCPPTRDGHLDLSALGL